ncbi:hypothetical protein DAEQUDRAFT_721019 [Daedalea quercina L-15889]|uniref:Uncharacterized protein n=1 Tax=Daedalea quercina L-15889 TaxID=1314783 RepID=A0A165TYG5_9APHY|nr:hypothetical protein DAEQUDRAFT_721019 [Daedalea quercina L-15889]
MSRHVTSLHADLDRGQGTSPPIPPRAAPGPVSRPPSRPPQSRLKNACTLPVCAMRSSLPAARRGRRASRGQAQPSLCKTVYMRQSATLQQQSTRTSAHRS